MIICVEIAKLQLFHSSKVKSGSVSPAWLSSVVKLAEQFGGSERNMAKSVQMEQSPLPFRIILRFEMILKSNMHFSPCLLHHFLLGSIPLKGEMYIVIDSLLHVMMSD